MRRAVTVLCCIVDKEHREHSLLKVHIFNIRTSVDYFVKITVIDSCFSE